MEHALPMGVVHRVHDLSVVERAAHVERPSRAMTLDVSPGTNSITMKDVLLLLSGEIDDVRMIEAGEQPWSQRSPVSTPCLCGT